MIKSSLNQAVWLRWQSTDASGSYGVDEIKAVTAVYESTLVEIGWVDRDDPLTGMLAKSILTVTATGKRDPEKIKERALHALAHSARHSLTAVRIGTNTNLPQSLALLNFLSSVRLAFYQNVAEFRHLACH
jgi:hypothetical protein